jgi:Na+-transporting NADH:ubiquinone oxidoreductase subunit NqrC
MKKFLLPLAVSLVSTAIVSGVAYAVKRQGGIEPTLDKLKQNRLVAGAVDRIKRIAANDTTDLAAAA